MLECLCGNVKWLALSSLSDDLDFMRMEGMLWFQNMCYHNSLLGFNVDCLGYIKFPSWKIFSLE